MKREIFLNMQDEIFKGNILDIGLKNNGIVYNVYKQYNDNINIDYISGEKEEKIKENFYDVCVLFFSLNSMWIKVNKKNFIKDIYKYLNKDGVLYIWDIDKGFKEIFCGTIKILIPENKVRYIKIKDLNILKDNSKSSTIKILKEYFEVLDEKSSNDLFYIKAKKKSDIEVNTKDENKLMKLSKEKQKRNVNSA